jgi:hypothetical protein
MPGKPVPYYWSVQEGEYATDLVFRSPEDLRSRYPFWAHQADALLEGRDLMRHMNYRLCKDGRPSTPGEAKSSVKDFAERTRVRHTAHGTLMKMYERP